MENENIGATEKFVRNRRKSNYVTIAWVGSVSILIVLRSNDLIDPTTTLGQILPVIALSAAW